jgi:hypothetical protein
MKSPKLDPKWEDRDTRKVSSMPVRTNRQSAGMDLENKIRSPLQATCVAAKKWVAA